MEGWHDPSMEKPMWLLMFGLHAVRAAVRHEGMKI